MANATVRIEDAKEYGYDAGFVIEQFRYWNFEDHKSWCIPAWEEMGLGSLEGVFASRDEAENALSSEREFLRDYGMEA